MLNIILSGCNGKMGHVISNLVSLSDDCQISCGIDIAKGNNEFEVYSSPNEITQKADVIIDFSHPACLTNLLAYAIKSKTPIVVATTGLSTAQIEELNQAAKLIPVFFTANMSLGVNLMIELVKKSAEILGDNFDIEIIEKHHNQKIDAPSGTALMLADEISASLPYNSSYVYDRHSQRKKRSKTEIGIHAVRGGTIVGEHEVIFAGVDEIISISHSAMSKEVFATGAIKAAKFLAKQTAGLYNMKDVVK